MQISGIYLTLIPKMVVLLPQTIMTVKSGGSVTSCVKIVLGHTTVAVLMDTSWSRVTCAKPMCQVQRVKE